MPPTNNDTLLLRRVLAEQRLPEQRKRFRHPSRRRNGGAIRCGAPARRQPASSRGGTVPLEVEDDSRGALALAGENWKIQREPADLRILVDAARATNDAATLRLASDWVSQTHLDDKAVLAALAGTR